MVVSMVAQDFSMAQPYHFYNEVSIYKFQFLKAQQKKKSFWTLLTSSFRSNPITQNPCAPLMVSVANFIAHIRLILIFQSSNQPKLLNN